MNSFVTGASGAGSHASIAPVPVLMAAMPLPDENVMSPPANSVVPFTTIEATTPVTAGAQPPTTAPLASSYALSWPASVAMNTRAAACSSAVTAPVGAGEGAHAVTEPPDVMRANPARAMPATCVNVPAMYQPPAPSGIIAVTSPSSRG